MKLPNNKKQPFIAYHHNQQYLHPFCFKPSETKPVESSAGEATDSWAEVVDGEEQVHQGQ